MRNFGCAPIHLARSQRSLVDTVVMDKSARAIKKQTRCCAFRGKHTTRGHLLRAPCHAALGAPVQCFARCKRCVTGGPLWVCLCCWSGIAELFKEIVAGNKGKSTAIVHPVLDALGGVDFSSLSRHSDGSAAALKDCTLLKSFALRPSADGPWWDWQQECCPLCYNPAMPPPRPILPPAARDAAGDIDYQVVLHGTINCLNDYGEERQQRVRATPTPLHLHPHPLPSPSANKEI